MSEIYALIVVHTSISPDYFLDRMSPFELEPVLKEILEVRKEAWHQARLVAQAHYTDKIVFPWENVAPRSEDIPTEQETEVAIKKLLGNVKEPRT